MAVMRPAIALKSLQLSARVFRTLAAVDNSLLRGAGSELAFGAARMDIELV
jgi:hypothetical protein